MKIRPASGMGMTVHEALDKTSEVRSKEELLAYLQKYYAFWVPTIENVTIRPYGFDNRIGWDTYLICVDCKAALFSDGPI